MSLADHAFLALQTAVAGRFSLDREIGRGGMGIVFLARDVLLERQVAIKLLAPLFAGDEGMTRRFLREARIAAQCFHPNIVPIHAVEEANGLAWIVMPYVRGETLAERVQRLGPLPGEEVRRLGREVGWALAYAHQRGVVHRDIKPENILIEAASGRFLIADFGIARAGDASTTTSGAGVGAGTPRYMAPEQALGEDVDGRADLYALGATLYVAATGRPPFEANNSMALLTQHATAIAPSVRTLAPALPVALSDAIDRCLAKRPDDRYESAERFVEALAPAVGDASTAPALMSLARSAQSARSMLGWAAVAELTTILLALGEPANTFLGRGFLVNVGTWFASFVAFLGVVRAGEVLLEARHLLRDGQTRDDVAESLTSDATEKERPRAARWKYVASALGGAGLALAQATLVDQPHVPMVLLEILEATLVFGPALLIKHGLTGLLSGTALSRTLRERVARPVAGMLARLAGRGISEAPRALPQLDNAATEVLLDRAIHEAIAHLPSSMRPAVGDAAELASSLAREAERLRREDAQLVDEARAARHEGEDPARAAALEAARDGVRARLGTTIAALEAVRLEILRLDAGKTAGPGLTADLEAVRELGRRVDAGAEVRGLLEDRSPANSNP